MPVTCIIPVYNNQATVEHVISVACTHSQISQVIAVNDGSLDKTGEILNRAKVRFPKLTVLTHPKNLGKGAAVATGINRCTRDIILILDAELNKLSHSHINQLINNFRQGYDLVIAARERYDNPYFRLMGNLSGERIFRYKLIKPYLDLIASNGNGLEQIINFAHRQNKIKVIIAKNIGHQLKLHRKPFPKWIPDYMNELNQLVKTQYHLSRLKTPSA
jgi:glycosyltransferase involved in cell wall biosynthesis